MENIRIYDSNRFEDGMEGEDWHDCSEVSFEEDGSAEPTGKDAEEENTIADTNQHDDTNLVYEGITINAESFDEDEFTEPTDKEEENSKTHTNQPVRDATDKIEEYNAEEDDATKARDDAQVDNFED